MQERWVRPATRTADLLTTDIHEALRTLIALLAILNPIGAVPIFIALTNDESHQQRLQTAKIAARAVAVAR